MAGKIEKPVEEAGQIVVGKDGQPIQLPPVDFSPLPEAVPDVQPKVTIPEPVPQSDVDLSGKTVKELKKILLDDMKYDVAKDTASPQRVSVKWLINKYQELKGKMVC